LLIIGMTVGFACRPRRAWLRAQDGKLAFASSDKEDPARRAAFNRLLEDAGSWFPQTGRKVD
ncbi:MAG: hypothetical protein LBG11_07700, partial [Bifidobacteriaceae bacterium]|nr:hypothetical protein [Bifidobacteriaceae bacterium]